MDVYNVPDQGLADVYLIQGTESNPQVASQFKQFETMYNEGVPDYFVDQNLYFPTATSYGYICTGFEPTTDWEDHHRNFGLDGQDIQFNGATNESLPYVYYSPNYGYGQSPYNPYNPYIPGAMIGLDGSIIAPQQYYALPSYENSVSSPAYLPMVLQSRPDTIANGMADSMIDSGVSVDKIGGLIAKPNYPSNTSNSSITAVRDASNQRNSFARVSEGGRANTESGKQPLPGITSGRFNSQASPQISRVRGPQGAENGLHGKASSGSSQMKSVFTSSNGLSSFEGGDHGRAPVHKVKPKTIYGRGPNDEQNWGPGMNKSKNQLVVKAYTTRAGNPDAQGNIIIYTDQYNKVDFPVDYRNAKFFVIKSYSEDDVHKSIKYNVWSSTPNGNKKLNAAYEDAQRIAVAAGDPRGCPIFLFFSVNASGQFCGVAEMTGPVDFHRDMDFWQQDKWSGSFPVKWHIIKDLPNPNYRHIILENNENKPVTNSRDTQEICHRKGLEMLQIFKNHMLKTSLLDDFMYYENRQRVLQEERARLLMKSYENPYLVPLVDPPRKLQSIHEFPSIGDVNVTNSLTAVNKNKASVDGDSDNSVKNLDSTAINLINVGESRDDEVSADGVEEIKIESLTIQCDEPTASVSNTANSEPVNVVTIGSMPVKVMGNESSGFLTVGTIPLDPRALQRD